MAKRETTIIRDRIYGKVETSMARNRPKLSRLVGQFVDDNSESLFASHPGGRVRFGKAREDELYRLCGVTPEEVSEAIEATGLNDKSWYTRNNPLYVLLVTLVALFEKTRKGKEKGQALMLLACVIYSKRQHAHFKYNTGTAFENIMRYTVNNLSQKFLLKQKGNVFATLEATAEQSDRKYRRLLTSGKDVDVLAYVTNMYTRISQLVRKIANKFYENRESGKYLNLERETGEEEGEILDVTNVSFVITRATDNAYLAAKTGKPSQRVARVVAASNRVSQAALYGALESLFRDEEDRLRELIRLVLTVFLVDRGEPVENINSAKFNLVCLQTYAKSHTGEENVVALKRLLGELLEDYSEDYNRTQRAATKTGFRKALFMYVVAHIQQNR